MGGGRGQAIKTGQARATAALSSAVRNDQRAKTKMITSHDCPANENRPFECVRLNAASRGHLGVKRSGQRYEVAGP